jgi:membrane dipeptidase
VICPSQEALALHRESIVIDLHADTPDLMRHGYDFHKRHRPPLPRAAAIMHVDGPRMREGGLTAQVFGLFALPLPFRDHFPVVLSQISAVDAALERNPQGLRRVQTAEDIRQAKRDGVPACLQCLEGAHPLGGRLDRLEALRRRGLRAVGLLHFSANEAGRPAMGLGRDGSLGLTPFGRELVGFANACGLLLDLAHINRPGFLEAVRLSRDPVMVSHTGVTGVNQMWRNIDDEQLRAIAARGGCVGIIYSRAFLGGPGIEFLIRHLEHVIKVAGEDTPALGSDFDGYVVPPAELPDASTLPRITQALLERGHPSRVIQKILGQNALRVLEAVPPRN